MGERDREGKVDSQIERWREGMGRETGRGR